MVDDDDLLVRLGSHRLVPVVVVDGAAEAGVLANVLVQGGLPVAEVTLRTPGALDAIRALTADGRVLVGAGTVLTPAHAEAAVEAGARFLVAPGMSRATIARAQELGVPLIPGIATATEALAAIELGLSAVKFFPAETSGGAPALRALTAVFPELRFMPTGGIDLSRAVDYWRIPAVIAVGGSWMVPRDLLAAGDPAALVRLIATATETAANTT